MATREEIYTAIRNADKAGDSAAVRKLGDYLKTMPPDAPKPLDASSTHEMAVKAAEPSTASKIASNIVDYAPPIATIDAAGNLLSGAVATPIAGLAGIGAGVTNALGVTKTPAADVVRNVQSALTYQPRTKLGQATVGAISYPFQKLAEGADWAGAKTAQATGSPALGAAVNTGIQAIPALIAPEARGAFASAGRAVTGGGKIAASTAADAAALAAATEKAKAYVTGAAGLDWNSLSDSLKAKLTTVAQGAGHLEQLDPAALAREAKLQALPVPVPATRGQLTRDPVQLRNEGNVSATSAGAPIRDVHLAANQALLDNLDVLKDKVTGKGETSATATSPEDVGRSVQDTALGAKATASKAGYNALFKAARATEPDAAVSAQPLYELLDKNPDIQNLGWLDSWLKKGKVTSTDTAADGTVVQAQRPVTLNELNDLRSKATAIAGTGGKEGYYAGQVKAAVDAAMQDAPAGAAAWRKAIDAYKAHQAEFSDQSAVAKLIGEKAGTTDRSVALENTTKAIATGSIEDIRNVKRSLLTGGDEATRTAGRSAWRDVRSQVMQGIKDEATNGVAPNVDGSPNLTAIGLKRAIDRYGQAKLDEIFGPGTTRQINAIMDAAKDVKTLPPGREVGSSTLANVLAFLEKGITKVPVVGGTAVDIARGVAQLKNLGAGAREAKAATVTPLNEAVAKAAGKSARADYGRQAKGAVPLVPLSALSQPQR